MPRRRCRVNQPFVNLKFENLVWVTRISSDLFTRLQVNLIWSYWDQSGYGLLNSKNEFLTTRVSHCSHICKLDSLNQVKWSLEQIKIKKHDFPSRSVFAGLIACIPHKVFKRRRMSDLMKSSSYPRKLTICQFSEEETLLRKHLTKVLKRFHLSVSSDCWMAF